MSYAVERSIVEQAISEEPIGNIIKATYGGPTASSRRDVTAHVKSRVVNGGLSIFATNDTFGCDPAPGIVKTLEVTYQANGEEHIVMVPEMWEMRIGSIGATEDEDEIDIIQAVLSDPEEYDVEEYEPASVETRTSSEGVTR